MKSFYTFLFWPIFFISQLLALALISWHLVAQIHFAYPVGYKLLGLEQHIAQYAPINRNKEDFEFTTAKDHWRLFAEICDSIQNQGRGLADIRYTLQNGESRLLLHDREIIHLQDVANLVSHFYQLGFISLIVWLCGLTFIYFRKPKLPPMIKVMASFLLGIGIITAVVLLIGARDVFYWFHELVFPAGHQWFFYYQDSLMTTLMKAPHIFAFIAILLVTTLILLWCACVYAMNRWLTKQK
jgi:uncharacterized membrane protein